MTVSELCRRVPTGAILLLLTCFLFPIGEGQLAAQSSQDSTSTDEAAKYTIRLHREDGGASREVLDAGTVIITPKRFERILSIERRRRQKGYWQLSGAIGMGIPYPYNYSDGSYVRSNDGRGSSFVSSSGEIILANRIGGNYNEDLTRDLNLYPRIGIARQTKWGGYVHGTFGFYRGRSTANNDPYEGIGQAELRTITDSREDVVTHELGIQYTFFRYRRFRPYLGVAMMNHLYYRGEEVVNFYDGATRQSGVVNGFRSKEFFPGYTELSFTLGFQMEVSERFSVGAFLHAQEAWNIWLNAPVGIEARYSLK